MVVVKGRRQSSNVVDMRNPGDGTLPRDYARWRAMVSQKKRDILKRREAPARRRRKQRRTSQYRKR